MLVIADLSEWHPKCHSYSEIAQKIFGYKFKLLVDATLFILQLSFCAGQLYFIGNQIDAVVCHSTGGRDLFGNITGFGYCKNSHTYIALLTLPALLITFIRTYTFASYIAGFGVYIILISKMILVGYLSKLISKDAIANGSLKVIDFTQIVGNIGIASYLFEGNGVIMNVKAETKNQHLYHRIVILAVSMLCAIVVFLSGIVYFVYREETSPMFTFNL